MPVALDVALDDVDAVIRQEKLKLLEYREAQEKHILNNRILYFEPNSKQLEFVRAGKYKRRAVFAGNKLGKTTVGAVEGSSWAIGCRPYLPESDPDRIAGIPQDRGVKILVIAEDWDKVRELFTESSGNLEKRGAFIEWLPAAAISKTHKNQQGIVDIIYVEVKYKGRVRKSAIYFDTVKSFTHNGAAHESTDWDAIHLDEPAPRDMWTAISRGLVATSGYSWWLLTPLANAWMYYMFEENQLDYPDIYWYIVANMDDNPLLSEEDKAIFLRDLSPEEEDCRRRGRPLAFGSLVYSQYHEREGGNLLKKIPAGWKSLEKPPLACNIIIAIDPHPGTPNAVLCGAITPTHVIFYAERFEKEKISETGKWIKEMTQGTNLKYMLLDKIAWNKEPETGIRWCDILWSLGLPVQAASKEKTVGIMRTKEFFGAEPPKKILIHESLKVTRREIRQYAYNKENKPTDRDDHMMENLYRLTIHDNFCYYEPEPTIPLKVDKPLDLMEVNFNLPTM